MRKSTEVMMVLLAILMILAVAFAGCISSTRGDYGPLVPVTVTGKYIDYNHHLPDGDPYRMVCTSLGTYRVFGPYGYTSSDDDITVFSTIPINQTVYVRLNGGDLWWDYKTTCYQSGSGCTSCYNTVSCCCNQATPAPTPVPVSPCSCGCRSCGCGC